MTTQHPSDQTHCAPGGPAATPACACLSRRESIMAAGVVVAGAATLGACGADGTVGAAASSAASAAASAASGAIQAAEIPVGGGRIFEALEVVVTQPTAGEFKAFSAVCTHQACTVAEVANGVITCPCHGSQFDIATGEVRKGPATKALPPKSVSVGTDGLTVS